MGKFGHGNRNERGDQLLLLLITIRLLIAISRKKTFIKMDLKRSQSSNRLHAKQQRRHCKRYPGNLGNHHCVVKLRKK